MEILDQLQTKVRNAVQKIEELQAKVVELEDVKRQYEEKLASLVKEFGDDESSSSSAEGETEQSQEGQSQDNLYRHQY